MDAEDEILMLGCLLMRKRRNHEKRKQWLEKYFCCIIRCHSFSFVAIRCFSLYQSSFFIPRRTTRPSFYKQSFLFCFIKLKSLPNFVCSFIFDGLSSKVADVLAVFFDLNNHDNTVRIISKRFDIILMRINEKSHEKW